MPMSSMDENIKWWTCRAKQLQAELESLRGDNDRLRRDFERMYVVYMAKKAECDMMADSLDFGIMPGMTLAEMERRIIETTIERIGSPLKAAARLKIGVRTIYAKRANWDQEDRVST